MDSALFVIALIVAVGIIAYLPYSFCARQYADRSDFGQLQNIQIDLRGIQITINALLANKQRLSVHAQDAIDKVIADHYISRQARYETLERIKHNYLRRHPGHEEDFEKILASEPTLTPR